MLSSSEKAAVASELRAQISKCRKNGIAIAHADSHRHAHEEWGIASVVIALCREAGIPYLRKARNCGQGSAYPQRLYRYFLNLRIKKSGLARTTYFGSAADAISLLEKGGLKDTESVEIMVHPAHGPDGALIDMTEGADLGNIIKRLGAG
jgi:predicted glycoside hydrolase/deacetylase ChbG (UPF0249 family)